MPLPSNIHKPIIFVFTNSECLKKKFKSCFLDVPAGLGDFKPIHRQFIFPSLTFC